MTKYCLEGNHQGTGIYCTKCGQLISAVSFRLRWVKDGKAFDTELSKRLHVVTYPDGKPKEALFKSPNDRFFTVCIDRGGRVKGDLISSGKAKKWLEKYNAPPEAFEDGGWDIGEG